MKKLTIPDVSNKLFFGKEKSQRVISLSGKKGVFLSSLYKMNTILRKENHD